MSVTRVLCVGDPHFKLDNLDAASRLTEKVAETLREERVDGVVFLGDMLHHHKKVHTQCANLVVGMFRKILDEWGGVLVVIVGNHDMLSNQEYLREDGHWMAPLKHWREHGERFWVVDSPLRLPSLRGAVFSPYVYPGRFRDALEKAEGWERACAVFAHQEIRGAKMGAFVSDSGDEWKGGWPLLVSGHVHHKQWVGENVYYPGSSMQHSSAESGEAKSMAIVTLSDSAASVEREVPLSDVSRRSVFSRSFSDLSRGAAKVLQELKNARARGGIVPTLRVAATPEQARSLRASKRYAALKRECRVVFVHVSQSRPETRGPSELKKVGPEHFFERLLDSSDPEQRQLISEIRRRRRDFS